MAFDGLLPTIQILATSFCHFSVHPQILIKIFKQDFGISLSFFSESIDCSLFRWRTCIWRSAYFIWWEYASAWKVNLTVTRGRPLLIIVCFFGTFVSSKIYKMHTINVHRTECLVACDSSPRQTRCPRLELQCPVALTTALPELIWGTWHHSSPHR